jgi:hypothetical protein
MKNYLSFGGGVNSVALYLYLVDCMVDFEAVFVDHGADWPETYEYLQMFQGWLQARGLPSITVLKPLVQGSTSLYGHCWEKRFVPSFMRRWCTDKFKIRVIHKYYQKPAWEMLGIDFGESHRAKIQTRNGFECRYPLVEAEIDRAQCKAIIQDWGLPVPMKSGCYICPYQRVSQWKELRRKHPCLFQKAVDLEARNVAYRIEQGKKPMYISPRGGSLPSIVDESQSMLWEQDEYPPCNCGL